MTENKGIIAKVENLQERKWKNLLYKNNLVKDDQ